MFLALLKFLSIQCIKIILGSYTKQTNKPIKQHFQPLRIAFPLPIKSRKNTRTPKPIKHKDRNFHELMQRKPRKGQKGNTLSTQSRESELHSKAGSSRSSFLRTEQTFKNVDFRSAMAADFWSQVLKQTHTTQDKRIVVKMVMLEWPLLPYMEEEKMLFTIYSCSCWLQ